MAWEHLSVDKPHLVYIILGGFTSLFMLCSSVIKERLYIGEATVATLCGIIFGPHAAGLIDPGSWGNVDRITLEFSRIVLVVQCFAVGVELPKAYMERHWRSVTFLLIPVMTFGWLVTSLFIWAVMYDQLNWLDCLVIAACVTATDPVLASSVVGKGVYLVRYRPDANAVALHWFCYTILYECLFGCIYGVAVGYIARRAIRAAHERDLIDRESFLVFYFVLALFCAGSGSILGVDDLLVGFACGVGFSNDGWFTEKTEESHVSNVIDLLINLAFFVYFGTIIPWGLYNSDIIGLSPWKLVVIAILVLILRRIPIMLALKPVIPDIKTWREALFAGHFGPIGVGAIFVAILARAELETESTTPLAELPEPGFEHLNIIELIWPITTFLVITSILIHGSSIAVFTLGKHINTLTITMSYTKGNEKSVDWMDRLPRIQSRSKTSMSKGGESGDEEGALPDYPAATLPSGFLRRQKEEDTPKPFRPFGRGSNKHRNSGKLDSSDYRPGGPIDPSAIAPARREYDISPEKSESDTLAAMSEQTSSEGKESPPTSRGGTRRRKRREKEGEVYREGDDDIIEDEDGNVLEVLHADEDETEAERQRSLEHEVKQLMSDEDVEHGVSQRAENERPGVDTEARDAAQEADKGWRQFKKFAGWKSGKDDATPETEQKPRAEKDAKVGPPERRHGPARAFRFGRTIIVEDEDGEVIKKYDIPAPERSGLERKQSFVPGDVTAKTRERLQRMGTFMGMKAQQEEDGKEDSGEGPSGEGQRPQPQRRMSRKPAQEVGSDDDDGIRFTIGGQKRRMSKADFIKQIQQLDPKSRAEIVEESDVPEAVKREARADAAQQTREERSSVSGIRFAEQNKPSDGASKAASSSSGPRIRFGGASKKG
ncbi:hypothetical protein FH972_024508 [Carpinus fangiana]|uniref:Cation/H+ exchanger domain-containing protein n=1 Tax=Carpinus fangiana TaxID=176857 RepID=A0A5N6L0R3_9ROSI|nr:hypothetical protein FH972_024508 [Carpinus fangiana]